MVCDYIFLKASCSSYMQSKPLVVEMMQCSRLPEKHWQGGWQGGWQLLARDQPCAHTQGQEVSTMGLL